jgi:hypothetical protein
MNIKTYGLYTWRGLLVLTLCSYALCQTIRYAYTVSYPFSLGPIKIHEPDDYTRVIDVSRLLPGDYYISFGRIRGTCKATAGNQVLYDNRGNHGETLEKLMFHLDFKIRKGELTPPILLKCKADFGFYSAAYHDILVHSYPVGLMLQLWRAFNEMLLGPAVSLFLLYSLLSYRKSPRKGTSGHLSSNFTLLAWVMLAYGISLSGLPRLFLDDYSYAVINTFFRVAMSWVFYLLCATYSIHRWPIHLLFGVPSVALVGSYFIKSPELVDFILSGIDYSPFIVLISLYDLNRGEEKFRVSFFLKLMCTTWSLIVIPDLLLSWEQHHGAIPFPALATLLVIIVLFLQRVVEDRQSLQQAAATQALNVIKGLGHFDEKLKLVGRILFDNSNYDRLSIYIDTFILRLNHVRFQTYVRVLEVGKKESAADYSFISLEGSDGQKMKSAIESLTPLLYKGEQDQFHFSIVPVGRYAVINLNERVKKPSFLALESHELIMQVFSALTNLITQFDSFSEQLVSGLDSLRLLKGHGNYELNAGLIFFDVNGFSDNVRIYGKPYEKFIGQVFFPELLREVRKWSVPEGVIEGDSAYLICLQDLMVDKIEVEEAVYKTLCAIMDFVFNKSAILMRDNGYGFEPVKLQIGANMGTVMITCDEYKTRTTGDPVNFAKRLQQHAAPGSILVSNVLKEAWKEKPDLIFDSEVKSIEKMMRIYGTMAHHRSDPQFQTE